MPDIILMGSTLFGFIIFKDELNFNRNKAALALIVGFCSACWLLAGWASYGKIKNSEYLAIHEIPSDIGSSLYFKDGTKMKDFYEEFKVHLTEPEKYVVKKNDPYMFNFGVMCVIPYTKQYEVVPKSEIKKGENDDS